MATLQIRAGVSKGDDGQARPGVKLERRLDPAPTGTATMKIRDASGNEIPHESVRHLETAQPDRFAPSITPTKPAKKGK